MGKNFLWAVAVGVVLFLSVPPAWALDKEDSEVNLNNFERPLLGANQLYLNLNTGITWHDDRVKWETEDRWHQWNAGGEWGFGITGKVMVRIRGGFYFPAFSKPIVHSDTSRRILDGESTGVISWISNANNREKKSEHEGRWRQRDDFGAQLIIRPKTNLEFYVISDGSISWFREDVPDKVKLRERNYHQELLAGFKYIFGIPVKDETPPTLDLRRSPLPKIIDLNQWDRVLLHKGQVMVNLYGGARFVDQRLTLFSTLPVTDNLLINETRNWSIWTEDETARDAYTQGILGGNIAVGITNSLLLESGYRYNLPISYERFVTRKSGAGFIFYDENDRGQNEGWAGNAELNYRYNPWLQFYVAYNGQSDRSRFIGNTTFIGLGLGAESRGEKEFRLAEHRVFAGFTFLTPIKGDMNLSPEAKRNLNDIQRPLLRPLQVGANIYGGWRYVKDVFIMDVKENGTFSRFGGPIHDPDSPVFGITFGGLLSETGSYRFRTKINRSFHQGFVGADIYFGIFENLQFDVSALFYIPTRYSNTDNNVFRRGEEFSWHISPRFVFRPRPNFEAFLGANFDQIRTEMEDIGFTKKDTSYNVNGGIKILFP